MAMLWMHVEWHLPMPKFFGRFSNRGLTTFFGSTFFTANGAGATFLLTGFFFGRGCNWNWQKMFIIYLKWDIHGSTQVLLFAGYSMRHAHKVTENELFRTKISVQIFRVAISIGFNREIYWKLFDLPFGNNITAAKLRFVQHVRTLYAHRTT